VSISRDRSVKVYDVLGFDMIMMMKLPYTPGTAEWIFKVGSSRRLQYEPCGVACVPHFLVPVVQQDLTTVEIAGSYKAAPVLASCIGTVQHIFSC
jgi:hypothetical protein